MDFNEDQKAAIADLIAQAVQQANDAKNGEIIALQAKNSQLIGEKRDATEAAQRAANEKNAAESARVEKDQDYAGLRGLYETLQTEREALASKHAALEKEIQTERFDRSILEAINANDVSPTYREILTDSLRYRAEYRDGQTFMQGKPIADYLKDHLASDAGKALRAAPNNSGGGATGGSSNSNDEMTAETFNREKFFGWDRDKRDAWASKHKPELRGL